MASAQSGREEKEKTGARDRREREREGERERERMAAAAVAACPELLLFLLRRVLPDARRSLCCLVHVDGSIPPLRPLHPSLKQVTLR